VARRVGGAPRVPVSVGELLDKITILEIKWERIGDADKRANVRRELDALAVVRREVQPSVLLDCLRQALGPKAGHPGKIKNTAWGRAAAVIGLQPS